MNTTKVPRSLSILNSRDFFYYVLLLIQITMIFGGFLCTLVGVAYMFNVIENIDMVTSMS